MQGDKAQPVPNPFGGVTDPKLLHLLEMAKVLVDALTPEERALLESADPTIVDAPPEPEPVVRRPRPRRTPPPDVETVADQAARGPITPAQYVDDDGWGGLPVQMRS